MQRSKFENAMDIIIEKNYEKFPYPITLENDISIFYPSADLSFVSNTDIKDIISLKFGTSTVSISKQLNDIKISIKL